MVLTAGEAEIRDGLGGTEWVGVGHLESGSNQFSRKPHPSSSNKQTNDIYSLILVLHVKYLTMQYGL